MRDFARLTAPALKVMHERHEDPKNVAKGDYPKEKYELWHKFTEEYVEVTEALSGVCMGTDNFEHLRDEIGDSMLVSAMLLEYVEEQMLKGKINESRSN